MLSPRYDAKRGTAALVGWARVGALMSAAASVGRPRVEALLPGAIIPLHGVRMAVSTSGCATGPTGQTDPFHGFFLRKFRSVWNEDSTLRNSDSARRPKTLHAWS